LLIPLGISESADQECADESAPVVDNPEGDRTEAVEKELKKWKIGIVSDFSWQQIWKWLRNGSDLTVVRARLDELASCYPTSQSYVEFLWNTRDCWAKCVVTWQMTFGYLATSMHEGIHSSWKICLKQIRLRLAQVPAFLRQSMKSRRINRAVKDARPGVKLGLNSLEAVCCSIGCRKLVTVCKRFIKDEGLMLFFKSLHDSGRYQVKEIFAESTILAAINSAIPQRGPSAGRFLTLVEKLSMSLPSAATNAPVSADEGDCQRDFKSLGRFFLVQARDVEAPSADVAFQSTDGNIACTRPNTAEWGFPDKVICSLFVNGHISLNPSRHFSEVYLLNREETLSESEIDKHTVMADSINQNTVGQLVTSACNTRWPEQFTQVEWAKKSSLGGAMNQPVPFSSRRISPSGSAFELAKETSLKHLHQLKILVQRNSRVGEVARVELNETMARLQKKANEDALLKSNCRAEALGIVTVPQNGASISSKRKR